MRLHWAVVDAGQVHRYLFGMFKVLLAISVLLMIQVAHGQSGHLLAHVDDISSFSSCGNHDADPSTQIDEDCDHSHTSCSLFGENVFNVGTFLNSPEPLEHQAGIPAGSLFLLKRPPKA